MLRNSKGMTLIEIMIVIVVLGGLAVFLGDRVFGARDKINVKNAKLIMADLGERLEGYYNDCGFYPTDDTGLDALTSAGEGSCDNWGPEAYIKKIPKDPWNNDLIYERDGSDYTITCLGKDGRSGGKGYDKDLVHPEE